MLGTDEAITCLDGRESLVIAAVAMSILASHLPAARARYAAPKRDEEVLALLYEASNDHTPMCNRQSNPCQLRNAVFTTITEMRPELRGDASIMAGTDAGRHGCRQGPAARADYVSILPQDIARSCLALTRLWRSSIAYSEY